MWVIWFGLILCGRGCFGFEDSGAVQFLISDADKVCVFSAQNHTVKCIRNGIPNVWRKAVDFNSNRGEIYEAYGSFGIKRAIIERHALDLKDTTGKLVVRLDKVEPSSSIDLLLEVEDLCVDWVHDKIYFIVNITTGSTLMRIDIPEPSSNSTVEPTVILRRDDVARKGGVVPPSTMVLKRVEVDPYEGTLYIVGQDYPDPPYTSTTTVCSANLNGTNLRRLIREPSHGYIHVNFNERYMYTLVTTKWYTTKKETGFDCELKVNEIPQYSISNSYNTFNLDSSLPFCYQQAYNHSREIFEFDLNLYILTGDKIKSYIVDMDVYDSLNISKEYSLTLDNTNSIRTLKVVDPRVQRRKQDGNYLCDRRDCEGGCEVRLVIGDTCLP